MGFWRGVGSAFNLFGCPMPQHSTRNPWQEDREALQGDWQAVGKDVDKAIRRLEQEHAEELGHSGSGGSDLADKRIGK